MFAVPAEQAQPEPSTGTCVGNSDSGFPSWHAPLHYNRDVKIYTKTGDGGKTSLLGGVRVSKADPRVEAYGAVDETNAAIGAARAAGVPSDVDAALLWIQRDLFALGAALADARTDPTKRDPKMQLGPADIARLESWIDEGDASLPPLRRFILPGGTPGGAALHFARTVSRRAERRIVTLAALGNAGATEITYVNRLSDLLFVFARVVNHRAGAPETEW